MIRSSSRNNARGFTVVELLIVIIVIGILAAISIVAYGNVQKTARDKLVLSDIDGVAAEITRYGTQHQGVYGSAVAWYSPNGTNANINFMPSSGNIIDVVGVTNDYCIRVYNSSSATHTTLATAATQGSTPGACTLYGLGASIAAGGVAPITNMIINPDVESGSTSPNGPYFSPTLAIDSTTAASGTNSIKVTTDNVNPEGAIWWTGATASGGTVYTCSVSLKGTVGKTVSVSGRAYTAAGAYIGEGYSAVTATLSASWQRVSLTFTAPATTGKIGIQYVHSPAEAGVVIWGDAAMCTQGATVYDYADGSSTGWTWNGTADNSSSIGYPL
ncbi:MAG TPA: carbohydrate binding domain-containing protein [Candidatus Microsaccharimonas sp.]|jgi:prepilin-type N-terminal cleavage/methylation domain-containing protein